MVACTGSVAHRKGLCALERPITLGAVVQPKKGYKFTFILVVLFGIFLGKVSDFHLVLLGLACAEEDGDSDDRGSSPGDWTASTTSATAADGDATAGKREPSVARSHDDL